MLALLYAFSSALVAVLHSTIVCFLRQGNDVALALYEGMGFELAALEDEMMARSRRRPPRIYLSKPLRE